MANRVAAINLELYDQAKEYYIEALGGARKMGDEAMVSVTLIDLGEVYTFQGDYQLAEECYSEANIILQKLGDRIRMADIDSGHALVAIKQGDFNRAHDLLVRSIQVLHEVGRKGSAILSIERLAFVAAEQQYLEFAVRLLSASDSQRKAIGLPRWPIDREDYERCLSTLHSQMEDAIFAAAWAKGSMMTMEELVTFSVNTEDHT